MSKDTDERTTPIELFQKLDSIFHFQLDAAATDGNALCHKYYTIETDGLKSPWAKSTFCNPPYSHGELKKWVTKAYEESKLGNSSVLILPGDSSTKWAMLARDYASYMYAVEGRFKFNGNTDVAMFATNLGLFGHFDFKQLVELKRILPGFIFENSLNERIHRVFHFEVIFPYKDLE